MTHDELLAKIVGNLYKSSTDWITPEFSSEPWAALCAVVELHKPVSEPATTCSECPAVVYPCPTIQAIEGELAPLSRSQIRRITKVKSDELQEKELK